MKRLIKTSMFIIAIGTMPFFVACNSGGDSKKTTSASGNDSHAHSYRCPMNCEKGKTYDKEGKCPVCGMNLEHYDGNDSDLTFKMQYASSPAQLEAGKAGTLSFTPTVVGKETEAVPLDVQHEKKIHLIVVSNDLGYFEHIHPEYQTDGSYKINVLEKGIVYSNGPGKNETHFDNGGDYTLFADYLPSGASHQVEKVSFNVNGTPRPSVTFSADKLSGKSENFTVVLSPTGSKLITGALMHIAGTVMKDGKEIDANSLENYLGAKAHMVVVSLSDKEYLHVHPDVSGGKFDLHTTFAKPGVYRGWIQFQSGGKVHTIDFTMNVKEGTEEDIKNMNKAHGEFHTEKTDDHKH
jgi:Heavy metal binding domain